MTTVLKLSKNVVEIDMVSGEVINNNTSPFDASAVVCTEPWQLMRVLDENCWNTGGIEDITFSKTRNLFIAHWFSGTTTLFDVYGNEIQ